MAGSTRRARPSLRTRLAVTAGIGAAVVLATPGPAMATGDPLTPTVTCVQQAPNGSWTAVFGYTNTSSSALTVRRGGDNDFDPDRFNGPQIETFRPGAYQGAFSVSVPSGYSSIQWELGDRRVTAYRDRSTPCPASTELPADGNGLGIVIALAASGAVAGGSMWLAQRRTQHRAALAAAATAD
ncbi:hypothetical protein SAMN05660657_00415 [Geodermatophilus amargosae]|uniref:Uncharacterized protein n=1 Tax=Geodermatophilus amargosae TaxID=1296565 RepID=A0A1I6XD35_9ACTN|nr:hypothetical protein [Geodermatophilus amargosae]SFT36096.1 hypothetical protein SAMN05660657_00415 [Geodermatophilus amargosae]